MSMRSGVRSMRCRIEASCSSPSSAESGSGVAVTSEAGSSPVSSRVCASVAHPSAVAAARRVAGVLRSPASMRIHVGVETPACLAASTWVSPRSFRRTRNRCATSSWFLPDILRIYHRCWTSWGVHYMFATPHRRSVLHRHVPKVSGVLAHGGPCTQVESESNLHRRHSPSVFPTRP